MKTKILVLAFLLSSFTAMAQVTTTIFHEKDAFNAMPALKQVEAKDAALKRMPAVDVKKLLEEDTELEGAMC